jgi:hypothetical protein
MSELPIEAFKSSLLLTKSSFHILWLLLEDIHLETKLSNEVGEERVFPPLLSVLRNWITYWGSQHQSGQIIHHVQIPLWPITQPLRKHETLWWNVPELFEGRPIEFHLINKSEVLFSSKRSPQILGFTDTCESCSLCCFFPFSNFISRFRQKFPVFSSRFPPSHAVQRFDFSISLLHNTAVHCSQSALRARQKQHFLWRVWWTVRK